MIGKIFFARVDVAGVAFSPVTHAREDLVVFSASISQVRGDAASITIEYLRPDGGLRAGPRWGILSAEIGGVVKELARGEIKVTPLALIGKTMTVELVCRAAKASMLVDDLFRSQDHLVPRHVDPTDDARRSEPYLLSDVYHDPRTLVPSLDPIAGSAAPVLTLHGAGADPDVATILDLSISLTDAAVDEVTLTEITDFRQDLWRRVDLGGAISDVPLAERATYTPEGLRSSVAGISMDGGYELKGATVEYTPLVPLKVYTTARKVDPFTCIVRAADYVEYPLMKIDDLFLNTFINAVQDRRERLSVPIEVRVADIGGAVQLTESAALSDADSLARISYSLNYSVYRPNPLIPGAVLTTTYTTHRRGVADSIWMSGGAMRATCIPSLTAMIRRAARVAVERAHCVQLTVSTHDIRALGITLKDRVRIVDARLTGGQAVGKVVGLGIEIGTSAITTITLACPVSDPDDLSAADGTGPDGLAELVISTAFESADPTPYTEALNAVSSGVAGGLVESMALVDGVVEQTAACGGTGDGPDDIQIEDPELKMPVSGLSMTLRDLSPVSIDELGIRDLLLQPTILRLPEGITI